MTKKVKAFSYQRCIHRDEQSPFSERAFRSPQVKGIVAR
jgi:hypothetical protein